MIGKWGIGKETRGILLAMGINYYLWAINDSNCISDVIEIQFLKRGL
jgi:hypothetical protein